MKTKRRRTRGTGPRKERGEVQKAPGTGPERFTTERFFGGAGDVVAKHLTGASLSSGYQLQTKMIHPQMLPAILILACYSRYYEDVELVDDYDRLLEETRETLAEVAHPDKYLASCIIILSAQDQHPTLQAFEDVRVPDIYNQLIRVEE